MCLELPLSTLRAYSSDQMSNVPYLVLYEVGNDVI